MVVARNSLTQHPGAESNPPARIPQQRCQRRHTRSYADRVAGKQQLHGRCMEGCTNATPDLIAFRKRAFPDVHILTITILHQYQHHAPSPFQILCDLPATSWK